MRLVVLLIAAALLLAAEVPYQFDIHTVETGTAGGADSISVVDMNSDGKPDVVASAEAAILWFENPGWRRHLAVKGGYPYAYFEVQAGASPWGRVGRVPHLGVITGPSAAVTIFRQPVKPLNPRGPTLVEPAVVPNASWEANAVLPGGVRTLAWADFDADGSDELATGGKRLAVHDRGAGGEWVEYRVAGGVVQAVTAADLNGDGLPDLAAADTTGRVLICINATRLPWKRHVIASGYMNQTAIAADFTGDGKLDVIASAGPQQRTYLYVAPDWRPFVLQSRTAAIHSAVLDVDGDGDADYVGARYSPGLLFWLENPGSPPRAAWAFHVIDDAKTGGIDGIHGLATGDVDRDGTLDLIANSAQPKGAFANSIAWFRIPADPRHAAGWERHVFARGDAPGLSHYHGFGDVNGDGRGDIASAAKIGEEGNWFAWWEQPPDAAGAWTKHLISAHEIGATNILIADLNGDGRNDFLASRGHGKGLVWFESPDWTPHQINSRLVGPHSLAAGDIYGDGDIDAATCAKDSHIAAWFENDGLGGFTTHHIYEDEASYDARLVDLDGDGDLDLLNAGQASRNVVWFENRLNE